MLLQMQYLFVQQLQITKNDKSLTGLGIRVQSTIFDQLCTLYTLK